MRRSAIICIVVTLMLSACKPEFEPIDYGHDACAHCKMTIMDKRYAAEIVTPKGKAFKFDDISCLKKYMTEAHLKAEGLFFVAGYNNPDGRFTDATKAIYLHGETFKSPMGGNYAAFASMADAQRLKDSLHIEQTDWLNVE